MSAADTVAARILEMKKNKKNVTVAIDGRCGSGKTTLAEILQEKLPCTVLHMDDYFLRPEQRTEERLRQPGENVDHERFLAEVMEPLKTRSTFAYRPFDCSVQRVLDPVEVEPAEIVIVEGSYCCHPQLWDLYDLHIFITVDPEVQMNRLRRRNGDYARVFEQKWIPLEERYISAFEVQKRCELTLNL